MVIIGIGILLSIHHPPSFNPPIATVNITQVNLTITYLTPNSCHYFGDAKILPFVYNVVSGTGFVYNISLTDWPCNPTNKHGFNNISVGPSNIFSIANYTPKSNYTVGWGGTDTTHIVIETSSQAYNGPLNINIKTS